jgi:hypothetical protein
MPGQAGGYLYLLEPSTSMLSSSHARLSRSAMWSATAVTV